MQSIQNPNFQAHQKNHFARLFPELEPLYVSDKDLWCIAQLMMDWQARALEPSTTISNGLAIFSQFLAHDITFEAVSKLKGINQVRTFQNDRTVNLDLDCLYGQRTQDFFYDASDSDKLLLGKRYSDEERIWYDLQRNSQCKAIIPDSRNDENIIVSRMQVLFIHFHNAMVDHLRKQNCRTNIFAEARKQVIWHYQWLIIHEYLYKMLDLGVYNRLMEDACQYYTAPHVLPLEFTGAAFRTGHSQTRDLNRISEQTEKDLFELGFFEAMEEYVDWRYLFDFNDGKVQYANRIDTVVAKAFHKIPFIKTTNPKEQSLPFRNLKRGVVYGLPSGEAVAMRMGEEPLEINEIKKLNLSGTPLWYYLLKEAEILGNNGEHLGPVGSTLLGECFFTIMQHDDLSYLKIYPRWKPEIGRQAGKFDFIDLICFAEENLE